MTLRPTSRFSSPGLALLAPAAERRRWTDETSPFRTGLMSKERGSAMRSFG
jgi:hypothetical protein